MKIDIDRYIHIYKYIKMESNKQREIYISEWIHRHIERYIQIDTQRERDIKKYINKYKQ